MLVLRLLGKDPVQSMYNNLRLNIVSNVFQKFNALVRDIIQSTPTDIMCDLLCSNVSVQCSRK